MEKNENKENVKAEIGSSFKELRTVKVTEIEKDSQKLKGFTYGIQSALF